MKYLLVIFIAAQSGGVNPTVIEQVFETHVSCMSAGLTMKMRQPKRIIWWNCEPMQDIGDE
jgi:hypothetical protein